MKGVVCCCNPNPHSLCSQCMCTSLERATVFLRFMPNLGEFWVIFPLRRLKIDLAMKTFKWFYWVIDLLETWSRNCFKTRVPKHNYTITQDDCVMPMLQLACNPASVISPNYLYFTVSLIEYSARQLRRLAILKDCLALWVMLLWKWFFPSNCTFYQLSWVIGTNIREQSFINAILATVFLALFFSS